jgi:hypothetical protein
MNAYWIAALAMTAALILWALPSLRKYLLVWAPVGIDDWAARWLHWVMLVLVLILAGAGYTRTKADSWVRQDHSDQKHEQAEATESRKSEGAAQQTGQTAEGSSHETEPERQDGLKIVVIEASASSSREYPPGLRANIEAELEQSFRTTGIRLLADHTLREDLIRELQRYQQGRALYDPATLKQVEPGHFHGATHGVFWSVTGAGSSPVIECRLVRLLTSEIVTTASATSNIEDTPDSSVQQIATALLADIAEVKIEVPAPNDDCGRTITVRGRVSYFPKNWTLWVTMLPDGKSNHYPQRFATMQRNGFFFAPEVYLGEEAISQTQRFSIYAVMADEEYSARISAYLAHPNDVGLDISNWPRQHSRIIANVPVNRSPSMAVGCRRG